jgi:hypothetical protein
MSAKARALDEQENYWAGFLYDKDCQSAIVRYYFSPGIETTRTRDFDVVIEARENGRTPVTSNREDFIHFTRDAQRKDLNTDCQDCWGLAVIPNQDLVREDALRRANIKHDLRLGGRMIPWKAIAYANLCVRVERDGSVQVSRFERCRFCDRDYPINVGWYLDLPTL